jgi:hypothetical protein
MIPNRTAAGSGVIGVFRDQGLDLSQLKKNRRLRLLR